MKIDEYKTLLEVVKGEFIAVVWTHKIQEKQAEIYSSRYRIMETLNILFSALTACGIITTIFVDGILMKSIAAVFSFGTLFISAYFRSFDLSALEQQHKSSATQFLIIRNQLVRLIAKIKTRDESLSALNHEYQDIINRLNALYKSAPPTTPKASKKAKAALNKENEYSYSEEEIDRFLPPTLRGDCIK